MLVHNVLYGCQNGSNKPFPNLSHYLLSLSKVNLNSKNNGPILLFKTMQQLAKGDISHVIVDKQGAKKIIFTACHSGKLNLTFTSPDVISTSPKSFLRSRIDLTVLLLFEFLKKDHLPVGQVKNRIH